VYCLEEWRVKQIILATVGQCHPSGTKFTPMGQLCSCGSKFAPWGKIKNQHRLKNSQFRHEKLLDHFCFLE
jgi:hypothetical protein